MCSAIHQTSQITNYYYYNHCGAVSCSGQLALMYEVVMHVLYIQSTHAL